MGKSNFEDHDLGSCCANFQSFFGPPGLAWLLPIRAKNAQGYYPKAALFDNAKDMNKLYTVTSVAKLGIVKVATSSAKFLQNLIKHEVAFKRRMPREDIASSEYPIQWET